MGKRSKFKRMKADFYMTPFSAFKPIANILFERYGKSFAFIDPCYGTGRIPLHLINIFPDARLHAAFDIERYDPDEFGYGPEIHDSIHGNRVAEVAKNADIIITNPPWSRPLFHAAIENWTSTGKDVWLLADANWMFTKQARPYLTKCELIVNIGRVKWIEGTSMSGKDDAVWYLFHNREKENRYPYFVNG